ncbi:uncharacterized protein LOC128896718 [Hylaeus anthracinus]|uniref:uncharacterized protein LOC128896718 n=1 Tax=Hylaeus anthracinus TaxID=313031 RepID=UPI0023BA24DC|nr:uncharacterized protein LOC128896718 [Hylaeus anthracinus]XP_054016125.1 uncharacterized protein LOC128896718 [Hylaeus anthracinus]
MLAKAFLLLTVMVAGMYAKPVVQSTNDSSKIDDGTLAEVKTEDEEVITSVFNDGGAENTLSSTTAKPGLLTWFLTPLTQNFQFSPQSFLKDRITNLKESLGSLNVQGREDTKAKQLSAATGLLQIAGPSDSGFYTNRLEPAGFFGGNGWLANKGGILGGPGAILSTGSLLTDYPTPYRRK